LTGAQYVVWGSRESTLRVLCVLCVSAVKENEKHLNRKAQRTQRTRRVENHSEMLLTDPRRAHNMRALSKCIIGVVLVHT
jgi:heme exporter protein D